MSDQALPTKKELASDLVQEIAKSGEQVPDKFLQKNRIPEAINDPDMWKNSLLIDFSKLTSSAPAAGDELVKLRSALCEWGCFQVVNHGIESSFLEEMFEVVKQFFTLPTEEKLKCSAIDENILGYGKGKFYAGAQGADWNDGLYLTIYPDEKRTLEFYPQKPKKFREIIDEYSEKIAAMAETIHKAMARSLDLKDDLFLVYQGKQTQIKARFIYYPHCPFPDRVLGLKPHSDGTYMTVVLPDNEVEGLQVVKGEQWYNVLVIPGALFINLGDLGEVMSNGMFKSAVHRVVTNSKKSRTSVVAFWIPEDGHEIGPARELVNENHPQKYKKFDFDEFRRAFFRMHGQGLTPLDAFKLKQLF